MVYGSLTMDFSKFATVLAISYFYNKRTARLSKQESRAVLLRNKAARKSFFWYVVI